jgi:hypothetical protein
MNELNDTSVMKNVKDKVANDALRIAIPTNENNKFDEGTSPPIVNNKLTNLQDSIKVTKDRKTRKSFTESLADLTKAMTVDVNIKAKLAENDSRMTLPQFRKWLMSGNINEIYMHGKTNEPYPIRLWLAEDGYSLRYDRIHDYCGLCKRSVHKDHYEGHIDLRAVGEIRRGRKTTNLKRTKKYVDDDDEDEGDEEATYFSLITARQSFDFDCMDTDDFNALMDGLENMLHSYPNRQSNSIANVESIYSEPPTGVVQNVYLFMYNKYMDRFILFCIVTSVLIMAYSGKGADKNALVILGVVEYVVAVIFTIEALLRIWALEGIMPYLKNPWNVLDFTIVCLGWITELPFITGVNFSAFRAFRALRALRTMKYLSGLREVVDTFIATLEGIVLAFFVYMYFCWLFAIFALDVFGNAMNYRCVVPKINSMPNQTYYESRPFKNFNLAVPAMYCTPEAATSGIGTNSSIVDSSCPNNQYCQRVTSLAGGRIGFHDIGTSFLTIMKLASKAPGMSSIMKPIMGSRSDLFIFYFLSITIFVSALVIALFIAIVRVSFIETRKKTKLENEKRNEKISKKLKEEEKEKEEDDKEAANNLKIQGNVNVTEDDGQYKEDNEADLGAGPVVITEGISNDKNNDVSDPSLQAITSKRKDPDYVFGFLPANGFIVNKIRWFILHPNTDAFVMMCICVNCIFLAMDKHPMEAWYRTMLRIVEIFFTFLFLVEMILKMIGLRGVANYLFYDVNYKWNCFDAFIVTITIVDFFMSEFANGFVNISFLRVFRVGRLMRMLRSNKDLMNIISAIINSLPAMGNVLLFMTLIVVLFAILGMQLYGQTFPEENAFVNGVSQKVPVRSNFDSFITSMLTLFKVLTGGGGTWGIMYNAMKTANGPAAPVYFTTFSILSTSILLNFLIVILMSQFAPSKEEKQEMREERTLLMRRRASTKFTGGISLASDEDEDEHGGHSMKKLQTLGAGSNRVQRIKLGWRAIFVPRFISLQRMDYAFGMAPNNQFRLKVTSIVEHPTFEGGIITAIVISSLFLSLESPLYTDPTLHLVMYVADIFFMVIFVIEMLLKIFAYGFILPRKSYLSDAWNRLDFFVIIVSFIGMTGGGSSIGRTLRVGRILRPLRMINRNEGMKVIVDALLRSLTPVLYTVIILFAYFFLFGVLGVSLFMGRFYYCNDPSVSGKSTCVGIFKNKQGVITSRVWSNPPYNFDNIFSAIRTLFEIVAKRGWLQPLYSAMDITDIDKQPSRDNSPGFALYFMFFIFIGANFMLKIFVGIIVGMFRKFSGTALYTDAQLKWLVTKRMIASVKPKFKRPKNKIQAIPHDIVTNKYFEDFMTICIIVQLIFLGTQTATQSLEYTNTLIQVHWVFTVIYLIETVLRLLAFGIKRFASKFWNMWDFLIVILMFVLPFTFNTYKGVGVLRALQFSRITVLLRKFHGIEKLFDVLVKSIPPMLNVTALFLLLIYVFAVLGMQFFATVKKGQTNDIVADFTTFPQAVVSLYEIVAGENWMNFMRDMSISSPACTKTYPVASTNWIGTKTRTDCGDSVFAPIYFFAFFILVFCVFLNLYVATILDTFSAIAATEQKKHHKHAKTEVTITYEDFMAYREVWQHYDPYSTGTVEKSKIKNIVEDLNDREGCSIGFDIIMKKSWLMKLIAKIDLEFKLNKSSSEIPGSPKRGSSGATVVPISPKSGRTEEQLIPFNLLLQKLCQQYVPKDALGAEEYVKERMQGQLIARVISAMKIQHAVRTWLKKKSEGSLIDKIKKQMEEDEAEKGSN